MAYTLPLLWCTFWQYWSWSFIGSLFCVFLEDLQMGQVDCRHHRKKGRPRKLRTTVLPAEYNAHRHGTYMGQRMAVLAGGQSFCQLRSIKWVTWVPFLPWRYPWFTTVTCVDVIQLECYTSDYHLIRTFSHCMISSHHLRRPFFFT